MYCSGVAVVLRWRWTVDMRGFLIPWFPRECADDRSSVRGDVRVANEDAVAVPADFERARARCRKNHTLARCKNGHDADRRSRHALGKGGDDMKAIFLDRIVGNARYFTEVDVPGLDRTEAFSVGRPKRSESECGGEKYVADGHGDPLVCRDGNVRGGRLRRRP